MADTTRNSVTNYESKAGTKQSSRIQSERPSEDIGGTTSDVLVGGCAVLCHILSFVSNNLLLQYVFLFL